MAEDCFAFSELGEGHGEEFDFFQVGMLGQGGQVTWLAGRRFTQVEGFELWGFGEAMEVAKLIAAGECHVFDGTVAAGRKAGHLAGHPDIELAQTANIDAVVPMPARAMGFVEIQVVDRGKGNAFKAINGAAGESEFGQGRAVFQEVKVVDSAAPEFEYTAMDELLQSVPVA